MDMLPSLSKLAATPYGFKVLIALPPPGPYCEFVSPGPPCCDPQPHTLQVLSQPTVGLVCRVDLMAFMLASSKSISMQELSDLMSQ